MGQKDRESEAFLARVAELEAEVDRFKDQARRSHRRGAAMTWGWADRDRGVAADACPHPMDDAERDMWAKGWQWRDDQLALEQARAEVKRLRTDLASIRAASERSEGK